MPQFNIAEAKAHFSELIEKVLLGEEVIVAKDNKPVAKIVLLCPKYELRPTPSEDIAQGWIWVRDAGRKARLKGRRPVVKLTFSGADGVGAKSVYCEAVYADDHDLSRFKDYFSSHGHDTFNETDDCLVFINQWYRELLGIKAHSGTLIELTVDFRRHQPAFLWHAYACMAHPQVVVRLATWLGLIALGLGLCGVGFGLLPLGDATWLPCALHVPIRYAGWLFAFVGLAEIGCSFWLVTKYGA